MALLRLQGCNQDGPGPIEFIREEGILQSRFQRQGHLERPLMSANYRAKGPLQLVLIVDTPGLQDCTTNVGDLVNQSTTVYLASSVNLLTVCLGMGTPVTSRTMA